MPTPPVDYVPIETLEACRVQFVNSVRAIMPMVSAGLALVMVFPFVFRLHRAMLSDAPTETPNLDNEPLRVRLLDHGIKRGEVAYLGVSSSKEVPFIVSKIPIPQTDLYGGWYEPAGLVRVQCIRKDNVSLVKRHTGRS